MDYFFDGGYVDPKVVSFEATPSVVEIGSTVASVSLTWALSISVSAIKIDGVDILTNDTTAQKVGPFKANQSWKITISDGLNTDSAKATLSFQNKIYFGFTSALTADAVAISGLDSSTFASKHNLVTEIGSPSGKVFCYAYPARFGAPKMVLKTVGSPVRASPNHVTTLFKDFTTATVSFTNPSGFTEKYTIIRFNAGNELATFRFA